MRTGRWVKRDWARGCCLICACMLVGGVVGSIIITSEVGPLEIPGSILEDSGLPPGPGDGRPGVYAVGRRLRVHIHLLRGVFGMAAGGVIGLLLVIRGIHDKIAQMNLVRRAPFLSARNMLYVFCCVFLFLTLWITCAHVLLRKARPLNVLTYSLISKYSAIFAALVSWITVGRKIWVGQTIRRMFNWLSLGPFNYIQFKNLNVAQHKALWIGCAIALYLLLFPPWIAYRFETAGEGIGPSQFAGFHFLLSDEHALLGTAPYIIAKISHKIQLVLVFAVAACTVLAVVVVGKKGRLIAAGGRDSHQTVLRRRSRSK